MYRYVFISSIVFPSMQWQSPSVRDACRHNMHLLVLVVFFLCLHHAPRVDNALTQHLHSTSKKKQSMARRLRPRLGRPEGKQHRPQASQSTHSHTQTHTHKHTHTKADPERSWADPGHASFMSVFKSFHVSSNLKIISCS